MSLPDEIVFLFDCDNTRLDKRSSTGKISPHASRKRVRPERFYRKIRRPYGLPWCRRDASL